jgi:hypothetical protein
MCHKLEQQEDKQMHILSPPTGSMHGLYHISFFFYYLRPHLGVWKNFKPRQHITGVIVRERRGKQKNPNYIRLRQDLAMQ